MFDLNTIQAQMNLLKQVPVSVARALLSNGQQTINQAIMKAATSGSLFTGALPGGTARDNVKGHLQWHADNLAKFADPNAIYPSGDDLKKWTTQAFIEANAVEEGASWIDQAWSKMWAEIQAAISALPVAVAKKVNEVASGVVEGLTGIPMWAWYGIGGLVLFGVYKILTGPAGGALTSAYVGRKK